MKYDFPFVSQRPEFCIELPNVNCKKIIKFWRHKFIGIL